MTVEEYSPNDVLLDSGSFYNEGTYDQPVYNITPSIRNAEGFAVMAVNVPFSYNVIDAVSNTLVITMAGSASTWTVYIPPGTYNSTSFAVAFNNSITLQYNSLFPWDGGVAVTGGGLFSDLSLVYALSCFDYNDTSKFTFYTAPTGTAGVSTNFTINMTGTTACTQCLGFRSNSYNAIQGTILLGDAVTEISNVYYIEPPGTYQMSGPPFLYVYSDLAQGVKDGAVRTERTTSSILHGNLVNTNYKGLITYVNPLPLRIPFSKTTINRATFNLQIGQRTTYCAGSDYNYYSDSGVPITTNYLSLQGQSWQIHIRFFYKTETSIGYVMSGGDKYMHTESLHNGSNKPSQEQFDRRDIRPDRKGVKMISHRSAGVTSSHLK